MMKKIAAGEKHQYRVNAYWKHRLSGGALSPSAIQQHNYPSLLTVRDSEHGWLVNELIVRRESRWHLYIYV